MSKFILGDCMDAEFGMPSYPDKYFDLAIVDPPYGIGAGKMKMGHGNTLNYTTTKYKASAWDNLRPGKEYFDQLLRVSKNVMVWGGNYFTDYLTPSRHWIIWDKLIHYNMSFSQFEMCWVLNGNGCRKFDKYITAHGNNISNNKKLAAAKARIHPTQKPIDLYRWLLEKYAKPGDLILDTHVGSASSLIACESMGFDYVGFEIDEDYYNAAKNRMNKGIQLIIK